ncbi:MAG TPA: amidase [Solirubrobacteraceae bacterium]|nr:amidase [Solirubrobacteraceae bacterium]
MDPADLAFSGITRQAELIAQGEVSPRELVQTYLDRIERLDPQLNAFRVVFAERALAEADQAQGRQRAGGERPLLGVPVAIKDDIDVAGEVTAWGGVAHGPPASADAEVVRRLRTAGAIVIGKTNVPELTIWPFTESVRFGVTRNPWNTDRTPGGSSGGSAAAVAAGLVGVALGDDGGGSIRIPAACCGLVGLKPQRGRVSLMPRHRAWHGLSVNGGLTRSVRDTALLLDVIAGAVDGDDDRAPEPERSFTESASARPGRLRIAVSAKVPPGLIARVAPEVRRSLDETAELLRSLGHDVSREDPDYGLSGLSFIARYVRGIHDDAEEVAHPERLEPRTRGMARLGRLVSDRALARILRREDDQARRINGIFDRHDVVMTPTFATPPPLVGRWEGRGALWTFNGVASFVPYCAAFNHTGQPALAVPAGFTADGLPLSVQLVGRPNDEGTLLSLAAQLEAERRWADRRPPVS